MTVAFPSTYLTRTNVCEVYKYRRLRSDCHGKTKLGKLVVVVVVIIIIIIE
jgi:hypothetical protein